MILIIVALLSSALAAIIVDGPQSVNAVDGDTVSFSCTVRAEEIDLFVNGTAADEGDIVEKGFMQSAIDDIDTDTRQQSITATAMTQYNNTKITCRALTFDDNFIASVNFSDLAILLVQGPLSSVVSLSHSFIDSSTVNISWSPPFTLPGTDITGYNISATSNGTTTNYFTSDSYYVLLLTDITDSPCNEINITVSGYNGLNGSETNSLSGIYLPSVPDNNSIILVHANIFTEMNDQVHVILRANVSRICPGEYPTLLDLSIQYSNGSLVATHSDIPLVLLSDSLLTTSDMLILPADHRYTATVTFSNILGDFEVLSNFSFRTHSVQSVVLSDIIGPSIVIVCQFAPNTAAVGCLVLLDNESISVSGSGSRTGNEAVVTLTEVVAGLYRLRAFDIESDQSLSAAFEINSFLIMMATPITSTIILMSSSSTISNNVGLLDSTSMKFIGSASVTSTTIQTVQDTVIYNNVAIVIAGVCIVFTVLIVMIALIVIVIYRKHHLKHNGENTDSAEASQSDKGCHNRLARSSINSNQLLLDNDKVQSTIIYADLMDLQSQPNKPLNPPAVIYADVKVPPAIPPKKQIKESSSFHKEQNFNLKDNENVQITNLDEQTSVSDTSL